jgi:D-beta-D-heptose 7-phosphate kinase/D-beta-D-heptose 1-phosphate adenosyltransferase
MKIAVTSGYFDPVHSGHIECFNLAKQIVGQDGILVVIVNNDEQAVLKKGKSFMTCAERIKIISALKDVDLVIKSIDKDKTVCKTIQFIYDTYQENSLSNGEKYEYIFAKGGDAFSSSVPEKKICDELKITIIDNLGKKIQSSSVLTGIKEIGK